MRHVMFNYGKYMYQCTADSWLQLARQVAYDGTTVSPRNKPTRELLGVNLKFNDPRRNYIDPPGRKLNLPFAIQEFVDHMLGSNPGHSLLFNSRMMQFINKTSGRYDGGYGSRIWPDKADETTNQFVRCLNELKADPGSRRAVMTIHDPCHENFDGVDVACTLSLQFIKRDNKLHLITTMRSEDVYLGFCYDTYEFQLMQLAMADLLSCEPGSYSHNVGSLHLYETDMARLGAVTEGTPKPSMLSGQAPFSLKTFAQMKQELKYIDFISTALIVRSLDKRLPESDADDIWDAALSISSPYLAQCAVVIGAEVFRRFNMTDDAKLMTQALQGEFSGYFKERHPDAF